ncbi:uncharacterized protein LOC122245719 [Penaeus japonicus]|uniref:uncharacterized protein LOC122245719 n=1 Tax=Penaeus japonicus TaxID=27405 RepID=UPI001C712115|nr:uncharacterized protein LOC122245719 [Penaeus japonicus]
MARRTCRLQTFGLTPGYDVPGVDSLPSYSTGSSGSPDLALNKPAVQGDYFPGYPNPPTVVNGVLCRTDPMQCACTTVDDAWIRVDLEASILIKRVVVTASLTYDITYFANTDIHVGDTGSHLTDPIVASKDSTRPTSDLQEFTFSTAEGLPHHGRFTLNPPDYGHDVSVKAGDVRSRREGPRGKGYGGP